MFPIMGPVTAGVATSLLAHEGIRKHYYRKKYGLHGYIHHYKQERKAITHHLTMTWKEKIRAKNHLCHHTMKQMTKHIHQQLGGHPGPYQTQKAQKHAFRAMHG